MAAATTILTGPQVAERISAAVPDAIEETAEGWVRVRPDRLLEVARFLHDDRDTDAR